MSVSKLFTPKLMPMRKSDECFVNPPHNAEFPRYVATTDSGKPYSPLRMSKKSGVSTPDHRPHHPPITTKPQEDTEY